MRDAGVAVNLPDQDRGPVRLRETAEQLFMAAQRADTEPRGEKDMIGTLVETLADLGSPKRKAAMRKIAERIAESTGDDNG
jgi:hypothetical protein